MSKTTSPFKVGRPKKRSSSGVGFLKIAPDSSVSFVPLVGIDEMISAEMHEHWNVNPAIFHPCLGEDCPGCKVGNKSRFKAYLPVLTQDDGKKIYAFGITVFDQLDSIDEDLDGGVAGKTFKVSRRGSGFKTRYMVSALGKSVDVDGLMDDFPPIIPILGPATEEEIWAVLEDNGYDRDGGFTEPELRDDEEDEKWGSA